MMTYLLAIETSTEICSVALGKNTECITIVENEQGNSHAEKIILFVSEVLQQAGLKKSQLDAVCISEGPGSYTGLRIGVSSAKGLCAALDIPLIAVSTLQSMAWGAKEQYPNYKQYCPMIDAKRMEVYTAVYNHHLQPIQEINNLILDENAYSDFLSIDKLVFSGNGITKAQSLLSDNPNAVFCNRKTSARYLLALAYEKFLKQDFVDLAYFEPFYLKEFHAVKPKIKGL
ncbi:MAG: tRNA (adenosine(37)-N6)-threonylcarbamoyltransferase complex dimerization subunit type 1 TsaB [Bacteroidales bacterium]|jgi:tRNA threonylcarbamoyladenosine biosynthesis protein TsaB|nr:tRNA (adenosine(37)-N6)-threonylcarbamoyltransferase complex dimerization subunit type 1 TsaB [Bacteroidales bacterium]